MNEEAGAGDLAQRIAKHDVPAGQVAAWWLGGSGFVFKTTAGTQVYVDPYLSDAANAIFGLARGFPAPMRAEEARPDVVISTHWHEDHLDPQAIPLIARHSPATRFIMPPSAMARALSWGVPRERILPLSLGQSLAIADVTIVHVPARHDAGIAGWEVPDAMGVILETPGLQIYHTGDTEYDLRLRALKSHRLDVVIACINGAGGNMDAHEAALLAWQLGARTVMPMHHYLWAGNQAGEGATLDPGLFAATYRKLGGAGQVITPRVAAAFELPGLPADA
ncbi:MAG: MBL fold metallo-hydrolase [Chloroflexi bacterium]|nr:MBL fold metallo-hydrolase [Chloroflexota bacterium]